ncbi:hypothetical protein CMV_005637 [Castanea mollissima]|uniref:Uncharacterized protein n=1 Tax=Castanea mollissima TaxID=60419 RepID=A0A8J4VU57_9ROSI|nr:hypothetical protein CMV_005637 [Castanea mollissima]
MEKGTGQFCRSAGRCGAMRRGVHAGMPLGTLPCPMPASLGQITSFSKKPSFFWKSLQICGQATQPRPRQPPWACCQGQGMQPRHGQATQPTPRPRPRPRSPRQGQGQGSPHGRAAKAKACSSQGQGSAHGRAAKAKACTGHAAHAKAKAKAAPMGVLPRPRHAAAKAKAAPMSVLPRPRHAQATQPRPRQPPWAGCQGQVMHKACSQGQGQGSPHGRAAKAKAAPMGVLPRPRHAQGMQPGPRQPPCACSSHGQGSPHGHAAKAKACTRHAARP